MIGKCFSDCVMNFSLCVFYCLLFIWFFFFKQKTAYEMRISDWSSDVCSSDLEADGQWREAPWRRAVGRSHDHEQEAERHDDLGGQSGGQRVAARRIDRKSVV